MKNIYKIITVLLVLLYVYAILIIPEGINMTFYVYLKSIIFLCLFGMNGLLIFINYLKIIKIEEAIKQKRNT